MVKYDSRILRLLCYFYKEYGKLQGREVKSIEDVYRVIGDFMGYDMETIKTWARPGNSGPKSREELRKLEGFLGVPEGKLEIEEEDFKYMFTNRQLSDINKTAIFECFEAIKDYLNSDNIEEEECYCDMCYKIEKKGILIPEALYSKICDFQKAYLEPIIYENRKLFADCYTPDIGSFNDKGEFEVKDKDSLDKMMVRHFMKIHEIENAFDAFAKKELKPYLI